jgi:hypothetical protein
MLQNRNLDGENNDRPRVTLGFQSFDSQQIHPVSIILYGSTFRSSFRTQDSDGIFAQMKCSIRVWLDEKTYSLNLKVPSSHII